MARGASVTVDNNFTKGLITEFTAMNFPENAVTEGDNCVYDDRGAVSRRLGMDYENGFVKYATSSLTSNPNCYTEFKWHSVDSVGTTQFVVQQVGEKLFFFTVDSSAALSAGKKSFSVNLTTFGTSGTTAATISAVPCQYTSGRGYLFVAHKLCNPFYVAYDAGTDTITATQIDIEVRDFELLDDGLDIDQRPTVITNLHKYNLYNSAWGETARTESHGDQVMFTEWDNTRSDYPSNADIFWQFKNASGNVDFSKLKTKFQGNTPAPSGHYIYNAFNIDRTTKTGFAGLPTISSGQSRPSAICFYAGRVFYSGTNADKYSDKIYFSQIIDNDDKIGKCYQKNDPTSEDVADLLDDDGGVISLPLIETVVSMKVVADSLVILATNGVYTVSGTQTSPFKATDYTTTYISSIGGSSHLSVVEVDGGMMWWNNDAIYVLTRDNIGNFQVQNVSKVTVQTLFNSIPSANLPYVKGAYNKKDQIIQWLFSSDTTGFSYDRILEFNVVSKAFYTHTIDKTSAPRLVGILTVGGQKETIVLDNVTNNALAQVTNNALANVQIEVSSFSPSSELFKYATAGLISSGASGFTYSELWDTDLVDWAAQTGSGVSYNSYGISGYRVRGNLQTGFNSTPIAFVVKYLETGRCLVSGIWDYGFRQSSTNELYLTRPEVSYLVRRVKLRGKGKSLQIKFQSVGNNPFTLVGWTTYDTGGTNP